MGRPVAPAGRDTKARPPDRAEHLIMIDNSVANDMDDLALLL